MLFLTEVPSFSVGVERLPCMFRCRSQICQRAADVVAAHSSVVYTRGGALGRHTCSSCRAMKGHIFNFSVTAVAAHAQTLIEIFKTFVIVLVLDLEILIRTLWLYIVCVGSTLPCILL